MKLSISLPDVMANEIKNLAEQTQRNVSWWIQKAWLLARTQMIRGDAESAALRGALKKMLSLRGTLKKDFPDIDSVALSHLAFQRKK